MADVSKPSKQVLANDFDGKEIEDSLGRKIKLKKPNVLDKYDLYSALGDDAKNMMCLTYAIPLLHIALLDGMIVEAPKSYAQFRATLQRVGEEAIEAVNAYSSSLSDENKETLEKAKK